MRVERKRTTGSRKSATAGLSSQRVWEDAMVDRWAPFIVQKVAVDPEQMRRWLLDNFGARGCSLVTTGSLSFSLSIDLPTHSISHSSSSLLRIYGTGKSVGPYFPSVIVSPLPKNANMFPGSLYCIS